MKSEIILFLAVLQLTGAVETGLKSSKSHKQPAGRKSVRFSDNYDDTNSESNGVDFNFGEPLRKRKQSSGFSSSGTKKTPQASKTQQSRSQPQQPPLKLKSALKNSQSATGGAFDISSVGSTKGAFNEEASSLGINNEKRIIFSLSDEGPYVAPNPYRNVGPTPEYLSAVGPERFWLPPNAPVTEEFPGPFLQYYQGVPGQGPGATNRIRFEDTILPQVQGITGSRDIEIPTDPRDAIEIALQDGLAQVGNGYTAPYRVPCPLPPLNQVTPLPGGNIIDPLSPSVNNFQGPFFPDNPTNDGAYLLQPPEPQTFAQDIEDGPYIVERVRDPIVFFDPSQDQTVLFDPVQNFTRLFNPETDPQLPTEEDDELTTTSGTNNGALLKSTSQRKGKMPSFWILKKLDSQYDSYKNLEKATINGQMPSGNSKNGAVEKVIFQKSSIQPQKPSLSKKQHISYKKPAAAVPTQYKPKDQPENIKIQLTASNPNPNSLEKKMPANDNNKNNKKSDDRTQSNPHRVKLVYSPIVDVGIEHRYEGFKAKSNKSSCSTIKPSTQAIGISILLVFAALIL